MKYKKIIKNEPFMAMQFTGDIKSFNAIKAWAGPDFNYGFDLYETPFKDNLVYIRRHGEKIFIKIGSWVVEAPEEEGGLHVYRDEIFRERFEEAEE